MNIETNNLMWFVALPEVFADYGVEGGGTLLASGKIMKHAKDCGNMAIRHNGDSRVQGYDEVSIKDYLTHVDDYAGNTQEV